MLQRPTDQIPLATADGIARARALAPMIAAAAARIEAEAAIPAEIINAMHDARLFRLLIPRSCAACKRNGAAQNQDQREENAAALRGTPAARTRQSAEQIYEGADTKHRIREALTS